MTTQTETFMASQLNKNAPDVQPGDTVRVHQKIKEGSKERIQVFEGIVIARKHGKGVSATITVRKVVEGVGVERIFPLHSPVISKLEIISRGKTRRAKLYYLRTAKGRKARLKRKEFAAAIAEEPSLGQPEAAAPETPAAEPTTSPEQPEAAPAPETK